MTDRKDEVVAALMVPSRNCTICRNVLSAIYGGQQIESALVSGLLAASAVIIEQRKVIVNSAANNHSPPIFVGPLDDLYDAARQMLAARDTDTTER